MCLQDWIDVLLIGSIIPLVPWSHAEGVVVGGRGRDYREFYGSGLSDGWTCDVRAFVSVLTSPVI